MDIRRRVMLSQVGFWVAACAGLGLALGVGAFLVGIAFSGYTTVSGPAVIVTYLALWPYLLLRIVLSEKQLKSFFDMAPFAYLPGLSITGWALFGIPIGWCRAKRKLAEVPSKSE
jgi:hypothetical protein